MKFNHSGAAVFGQMLLKPAPENPPREVENWLGWYEGCGAAEATLLKEQTAGVRPSLSFDNASSLGDVFLEEAKAP